MNVAIKNLRVSFQKKEILHGVNATFRSGKVTAIMGPNGSGKSTLAHAIMGNPHYTVGYGSSIRLGTKELVNLPVEKRSQLGVFLSFQNPSAIPGVNVKELLRAAEECRGKKTLNVSALYKKIESTAKRLHISEDLLTRGVNHEFSGGERKKIELLQALMLSPKCVVFDEIDTGVDIDALKLIAKGVQELADKGASVVLITHNERILRYVSIDRVLVLVDGTIVGNGTRDLVKKISTNGYKQFLNTP